MRKEKGWVFNNSCISNNYYIICTGWSRTKHITKKNEIADNNESNVLENILDNNIVNDTIKNSTEEKMKTRLLLQIAKIQQAQTQVNIK